jgi:DNA-binding beta-propeller fold protein YncE
VNRACLLVALAAVVVGGSASAAAVASDIAGCNEPAADPIAWFDLPGQLPFQALPSSDGCWIFVSLATGDGEAGDDDPKGNIALLKRRRGHIDLVRVAHVGGNPNGMALTHDGRVLVVADGNRIAFLDTDRLISGDGGAVLGYWRDSAPAPEHEYVTITSDDKYLFVSDENVRTISVINLASAREVRFAQSPAAGKIPVGFGPVAVTLSPDERYLYVTALSMPASPDWPEECVREYDPHKSRQPQGAVFVIDVARAETDAASAVIAVAKAGCTPIRLVLSPSGDTAYVSGRGDNTLRAFDAHRLAADPDQSLLGKVSTGSTPIGIAVVDSGRKLVVTNSNRFGTSSTDQSLLLIDATRITAGDAAVLGAIPARSLPREMRTTSDGHTLLVVNTLSQQLQVIDLLKLAQVMHAANKR